MSNVSNLQKLDCGHLGGVRGKFHSAMRSMLIGRSKHNAATRAGTYCTYHQPELLKTHQALMSYVLVPITTFNFGATESLSLTLCHVTVAKASRVKLVVSLGVEGAMFSKSFFEPHIVWQMPGAPSTARQRHATAP